VAKVMASGLRKGNVVQIDDKLCVVMTAESTRPGKGTPTTQLEMRRIADGVKIVQRYKTTDQLERAYLEDANFQYLFKDGESYTFMNSENYEQTQVSADVIGDQAVYLQENMSVTLSLFEGVAVAIEMPQKVTLDITETEPTQKGQTASGSFKPAILSNGVRTMVPGHIAPGTRIVVMTEDGSYVERARD
jgi:elongation factor P